MLIYHKPNTPYPAYNHAVHPTKNLKNAKNLAFPCETLSSLTNQLMLPRDCFVPRNDGRGSKNQKNLVKSFEILSSTQTLKIKTRKTLAELSKTYQTIEFLTPGTTVALQPNSSTHGITAVIDTGLFSLVLLSHSNKLIIEQWREEQRKNKPEREREMSYSAKWKNTTRPCYYEISSAEKVASFLAMTGVFIKTQKTLAFLSNLSIPQNHINPKSYTRNVSSRLTFPHVKNYFLSKNVSPPAVSSSQNLSLFLQP